ncbi:hypothetical protein PMAYCL1PPCAC_19753, partial [Pristionchus mayeri]
DFVDVFVSMGKMGELTEREFYALVVLIYCDVDTSSHLPDEIISTSQKIRDEVFKELQEYYRKELNLNDFSNRLGNLMTFAQGAGELGLLMIEELRMYSTVFDIYSDDRLFQE